MKRGMATFGLMILSVASTWAQTAPTSGSTSAISLYGLIDTGVEYITNVGPTSGSVTRMPGLAGTLPSRWGVRGTEDLGDGLKAIFTLESGFGPDTGVSNQGGRAFGRQAFIGLTGSWGTVVAGRQYSMFFLSLFDADQLGPNNFGLGSHDAYIPNAREDNAVGYRGTFGGWTIGATYSLGRDAVNAGPSPSGMNCPGESATDTKACRAWSAMLKYDNKGWGVALATDQLRGGAGAFGGLSSSDKLDRRSTLNGYVNVGALKLSAGLIRRSNDGAAALSAVNGQSLRSDLAWIGAAYTVTPQFIIDGQVQQLAFRQGGDKSSLIAIRGNYHLSKRTMLYAMAGRIDTDGRLNFSLSSAQVSANPGAGEAQSGLMAGMRHSF